MMEQRESARSAPATLAAAGTAISDPGELPALIAAAKAKIQANDLEGGVAAFRAIAASYPDLPEVFNNLGAICAAMGKRAEAEEAFDRAIELFPDSANTYYNRGLMRFQGGNFLGALEDFESAASRNPKDPETHNNVGVTQFQLGRFAEAESSFQSALQLRPDYLQAKLNLVDVDLVEQRPDSAAARCEAMLDQHDEAEVVAKLAECRLVQAVRALDDATEACENALQSDPRNEALRWRLGNAAQAREQLLTAPTP